MENLNAKDKDRLQRAVDGNKSEQGYSFGTKQEYNSLVGAGYVVFNDAIKDGNKFALKATDTGIAALASGSNGGAVAVSASAKPTFEIRKQIALPPMKRRAAGEVGSKYPFDRLEVGDSFHVKPDADMPDPAKSLASSVTAANRRYAEKLEGTHKSRKGKEIQNYRYTREFTVRAVDKTDPDGEGARIWRTK